MTEQTAIDRIRYELGNIGIAIEATRDEADATMILARGTGNHRCASYALPKGVFTSDETDEQVSTAVQTIKEQIVSNSGSWPE